MKVSILALAVSVSGVVAKNDSNPYVPRFTQCPSDFTFVRRADSLSNGEQNFLKKRDENTRQALIDWLGKSNMSNFDASSFLSNQTIRIGLAYSGGGYRAMLAGAGQLAALDNRTSNAMDSGHLGGLLQASTYLAGLSGGNWLVGSIAVNNFTTVEALQADKKLWQLKNNILSPGGLNIFKTFGYWDTIINDVEAKQDAGWNISLTDLWGRGLSYQFINASEGGEGYSYSRIRDYEQFTNGDMPFPIHITDHRGIGESLISLNSSVFEFNPYEIGSWDPNQYHFSDVRYLGTAARNGRVNDGGNCTVGYDNAGYLMGTSATLFNQFILRINGTGIKGEIKKLAENILNNISEDSNDVSIINPNPFFGLDGVKDSQYTVMTLVDGGEDNMNIPIHPLYQPQRNVDVVVAFDNSADTDESWPNGNSLVATYERQFSTQGNGTHFPYVPDNLTFINNGLVAQPTFFGCNITNLTTLYASNTTSSSFTGPDPQNIPPVIVYIGNSAHSYFSNKSTFKLSYENDDRDAMIKNGYETMTQNNGTLDNEWRACLGCAIVLREQQRRGQSPTDQCQRCLSKYCWDGSTNTQSTNGANVMKRRDNQSNLIPSSSAAKKAKSKNRASSVSPSHAAVVLAIGAAALFF